MWLPAESTARSPVRGGGIVGTDVLDASGHPPGGSPAPGTVVRSDEVSTPTTSYVGAALRSSVSNLALAARAVAATRASYTAPPPTARSAARLSKRWYSASPSVRLPRKVRPRQSSRRRPALTGDRTSVTLPEHCRQLVIDAPARTSGPFGLRLGQQRQRVPLPVQITGDPGDVPDSVLERVELVDPRRDVQFLVRWWYRSNLFRIPVFQPSP